MKIRHQEVDLGGSRIHYLTAGTGPPIVLLHGLGQSAIDWQWVMPLLADRFRVIAPDFPGFGQSDRPRAAYSAALFSDFLAGLLDVLKIEEAVLTGNSLGGDAALRFALSEPGRVTALVLVDSAGLGREINLNLAAIAQPVVGEWATAWATTPIGQAQRIWFRIGLLFARPERVSLAWVAEQFRLEQRPDFLWNSLLASRALVDREGQREILRDRLPVLTMPTLIVWGENDQIIPIAHAREAIHRLQRGHLAIIPDCGHLPHVERPERFVQALEGFLDRSSGGQDDDRSNACCDSIIPIGRAV